MRKLSILAFLLVLVLFSSCESEENYTISKHKNSQIISLYNYRNIKYTPICTQITEDDINDAITSILISNSSTEKVTNRSDVRCGDTVYVDYLVLYEENILQVYNQIKIAIGKGLFNEQFESNLISAKIGEKTIFKHKIEDENNKEFFGKTVTIEATVTSIYQVFECELTDSFVKEKFNLNSVDEFYIMIESSLAKESSEEDKIRNGMAVLKIIFDNSKFLINAEELNKAFSSIYGQHTQLAYTYDLEFNDYLHDILNMSKADFENFCYSESRFQLMTPLIIHEIAERENIQVTDDELLVAQYEAGYSDLDILKSPYLKTELTMKILKDKVCSFLVSENVTE